MRKRRSSATIFLLSIAGVAALAQPGEAFQASSGGTRDPMRIIESSAARYQKLDGLCADFEQVVKVTLLRREVASRGRLCQRRPNLFSMRFSQPEGDLIVADGEFTWSYMPSAQKDQVLRFRLGRGAENFNFHEEFLSAPGEKYTPSYEGEEEVNGHATYRISLLPKRSADYKKVLLWLDKEGGLIRRAEITQENGSIRLITLSKMELNPKMEADVFRFSPPPGARVIER